MTQSPPTPPPTIRNQRPDQSFAEYYHYLTDCAIALRRNPPPEIERHRPRLAGEIITAAIQARANDIYIQDLRYELHGYIPADYTPPPQPPPPPPRIEPAPPPAPPPPQPEPPPLPPLADWERDKCLLGGGCPTHPHPAIRQRTGT